MLPWNQRPTEVANLLNPAFVGVLLRTAVDGYAKELQLGMPFELLFLVPPFCLHPATAKRLPRSPAVTPLHVWLQREENRDVLLSFAERASSVVPFVQEALLFCGERQILAVDSSGRFIAGDKQLRGMSKYRTVGEEVKEAIRLAELIGRWFALAGTTATVFTLLGIQP